MSGIIVEHVPIVTSISVTETLMKELMKRRAKAWNDIVVIGVASR